MTAQLSGLNGGNTYDVEDLLLSVRRLRTRTFGGTRIEPIPTWDDRDRRRKGRDLNPHPTEDITWQDRANCIDIATDVMFPGRNDPLGPARAKAICVGCPVKTDCLDFAIRHNEKYGVWGGMSARDLRAEKARRKGGTRLTLGPVKGHALIAKGRVDDDGGYGCECGAKPNVWPGVMVSRIWHREHKATIKGET
jgi:WhiB family redox-sensing transcriptional regulator